MKTWEIWWIRSELKILRSDTYILTSNDIEWDAFGDIADSLLFSDEMYISWAIVLSAVSINHKIYKTRAWRCLEYDSAFRPSQSVWLEFCLLLSADSLEDSINAQSFAQLSGQPWLIFSGQLMLRESLDKSYLFKSEWNCGFGLVNRSSLAWSTYVEINWPTPFSVVATYFAEVLSHRLIDWQSKRH